MSMDDSQAPVLVGVGEASRMSTGIEWPSPREIAAAAAREAIADSGAGEKLAKSIDCLIATRLFYDSAVPHDYGSPENFPEAVATTAGLNPETLIYADVGGQSPQRHLNQLAVDVHEGKHKAVMLCGAETTGTVKRAKRSGHQMDWSMPATRDFEDRRSDFKILTMYEIRHGIISMPLAYGILENARRGRQGKSREVYAHDMAELWAALSQVSLTRTHAQFPKEWSVEGLLTDGDGNYRLNDPYRRWMVAQDAVDVGAAVVLTTAGHARDLGIAPDKIVYLWAGADATVPLMSLQDNLSVSPAIDWAFRTALDKAELQAGDIGGIDIYSCFPVAVSHGIDALGLDRPLSEYTLTGGLSFFGGPGNSYSTHAIVAGVQALRQDGSKPALISANGGVISKESVGIYSTRPVPGGWTPDRIAPVRNFEPAANAESDYFTEGPAKIVSYVTDWSKEGPAKATLWVEDESGRKAIALTAEPVPDGDLLGETVTISNDGKRNHATL